MAEKRINWRKIKSEYINGQATQAELAKKYDVSRARISVKCAEEGWVNLRKQRESKAIAKSIDKKAEQQAQVLAMMDETMLNLMRMTQEVSRKAEQLTKYLVEERSFDGSTTIVEKEFEKVDSKMLKDLASTQKLLAEEARKHFGISTEAEKEQLKMARERLELEKAKASAYTDDEDDSTGVIVLAPVIGEDGGPDNE